MSAFLVLLVLFFLLGVFIAVYLASERSSDERDTAMILFFVLWFAGCCLGGVVLLSDGIEPNFAETTTFPSSQAPLVAARYVVASTQTPVDKFEFRVKEAIGFSVLPVNDPDTNDPDGDGDVEVLATPDGNGGSTASCDLSVFSIGKEPYSIEVRSVDSRGRTSSWRSYNAN